MESNNICRFNNVISSDLICTNFVYEETEAQIERTVADKYILGFVVKGKGVLNQNDQKYTISKGDAFFVKKNACFNINENEELAYFYISFYGRRADELVERFNLSDSNCVFGLCEHCEKLTAFGFDCLNNASDQKLDILSECGLLYLLAHLETNQRKADNLLQNIMELTNKNFTDPGFSLSTLSQMMGYSTKYLSFFFKKNKGICYSQYIRDLRIKHSVFLMEQGITSVKNVALLSGFSDALYYSKIFKQEIGKTPTEHIAELYDKQKNDN